MQIGAGFLFLALAAVALAPAAHADVRVSGKGPRIHTADGHVMPSGGRPVLIGVDELAAFGDKQVATAPPLEIRVVGDVEITPLEDGSVRIRFLDE